MGFWENPVRLRMRRLTCEFHTNYFGISRRREWPRFDVILGINLGQLLRIYTKYKLYAG